ncbi:MAG: GldG family protein [Planctomycetes bacterium]|nr:GldG family protein [Planctomycetota bacterium]
MNRILRAIIAVIFITVITVCSIVLCQNTSWRADITDQKLYTLSQGTKNILGSLNQPLKLRLYYTRTAAMKGPDQIRYFNNYYHFVRALLDEYVSASNSMVELEVIDPRPFSDEEAQAIRHGLTRFSITEEESFFFGLVIQTQFGVEKTIEFFSPDRQTFVEYDITYLIDNAITRDKKRIGVLSSLPVTGDDVTGYMAQMMRMQGQTPKQPWAVVRHLKQKFEVSSVPADTQAIENVDILLVVHPKSLPEQTLFAIDQFVIAGGRAIVCVDPHAMSDPPDEAKMRQRQFEPTSSNLPGLLNAWGLDMPDNTFAGDRAFAEVGPTRPNARPEKILPYMILEPPAFNNSTVITADLNMVRTLFAGVLNVTATEDSGLKYTPLLSTTERGNTWRVSSPLELLNPDYTAIMRRFFDGSSPVNMAYLVTGKFASAFPDGVEVTAPADPQNPDAQPETIKLTGLTEATEDCAVIVFADVDFISDIPGIAYQKSFFGVTPVADNASLLFNAIEDLAGSSDLISIRSRGSFKRPFTRVDDIETAAEVESAGEEAKINAKIAGFQQDLNKVLSSMTGDAPEVIGNTIVAEKKKIEQDMHDAQRQLRLIKMKKRERIDALKRKMMNFCTLPGPIITLIIAVALGIRRTVTKRHYISHASDA